MRILVTGHDGYVGTVMVGLLRAAGHDVVGVDAGFFDGCGFPGSKGSGTHRGTRADVRDVRADDLVGFDAVVHLAALSNDPLGSLNPELTYAINQAASIRVASLAKAAGVARFVFASSCSLYGAAGRDVLAEDAPLRPLTPYGESKVQAERAISRLADDSFSPVYMRSATAYGVSPRLRGDVVINNLVGSAVTRGEVKLLSDGLSWRPLVHVEDMCQAFMAVLEAPREAIHDQAFNLVAEGENYQIRDVAEMVAAQSPGCRVTFAPGGGDPDPRSYRVDGGKLASVVPGFKPRWNVESGIRQLFAVLGSAGLSEQEFFGPKFIRLARLRALLDGGAVDEQLRWCAGADPANAQRAAEGQGVGLAACREA